MSVLTGLTELDNIMGGLHPGELTVIAGRPSMGKTAFCFSIADNIQKSGKRVCVVALYEGIGGNYNSYEIPMYNYYYPNFPLDDFLKTANPPPDYNYEVIIFTALHPAGRKDAADICRKLKAFAVSENIAVVVEATVDWKLERLKNRRPMLEHVKYSSAFNKHADNILTIYRPAYYDGTADKSIFEVNVAKNSVGRLGTAVLKFEIDKVQMTVSVPKITNPGATNFIFIRICAGCGEEFDKLEVMPDGKDYCSQDCFEKWNKRCRDCGAIVPFGEGVTYDLPDEEPYVICDKCLKIGLK